MILARWHEIRDTMLADTKERERNLAAAVRRARRPHTEADCTMSIATLLSTVVSSLGPNLLTGSIV